MDDSMKEMMELMTDILGENLKFPKVLIDDKTIPNVQYKLNGWDLLVEGYLCYEPIDGPFPRLLKLAQPIGETDAKLLSKEEERKARALNRQKRQKSRAKEKIPIKDFPL